MGRRSKRKKLLLRRERLLGIEMDSQEASRVGLGHIVEERERLKKETLESEIAAQAKKELDKKKAAKIKTTEATKVETKTAKPTVSKIVKDDTKITKPKRTRRRTTKAKDK
jgi:hypothetical protein